MRTDFRRIHKAARVLAQRTIVQAHSSLLLCRCGKPPLLLRIRVDNKSGSFQIGNTAHTACLLEQVLGNRYGCGYLERRQSTHKFNRLGPIGLTSAIA
jgi:hypothetical protein